MGKVDLSQFTLFIPQVENRNYLMVSASGRITISKSIRDLMSGAINMSINEDGRQIVIQDNENNNMKLKKDGGFNCLQFAKALSELGIKLNARYTIVHCEDQNLWLATLDREEFGLRSTATPGHKLPPKKKAYNSKNFEV